MELRKEIKSNAVILKLRNTIYFLLGILEALLGFRLVFRFMGANPDSNFVSMIYEASDFFLVPFLGIFRAAVNQGIETASVLEPKTIIAMIVYALMGYGLVRLFEIGKHSTGNRN